jgi:renalase
LPEPDVLIVGAGLAGLVAARTLVGDGRTVRLLDKGVGPGGRLATRRIADATLDHGAQFITVRHDDFTTLLGRWRSSGVQIDRWSAGFAQAVDIRAGRAGVTSISGDGHPRYRVRGGMNALAKALVRDLDRSGSAAVLTGARVTAAWVRRDRWHVAVAGDGGQVHHARRLICTPPVPQTLALLARGATSLPADIAAALRMVTYDPCLALLTVLAGDPRLPRPGGVQFASGPVSWLADNARKGISTRPALTLHAAGDWSADWYAATDDEIGARLLAWLEPWLDGATVERWQVKRWRYAQPRVLVDQPTLATTIAGAPVVFAGDAFGHPRVEGAARSGLAAAAALRDG